MNRRYFCLIGTSVLAATIVGFAAPAPADEPITMNLG